MAEKHPVLIASFDAEITAPLARSLEGTEFEPIFAFSVAEALGILAEGSVVLVFCEDALLGGGFQKFLNGTRVLGMPMPVIVVSRSEDWEEFRTALRLGACDMVVPPFDRDEVASAIFAALQVVPLAKWGGGSNNAPKEVPQKPNTSAPPPTAPQRSSGRREDFWGSKRQASRSWRN